MSRVNRSQRALLRRPRAAAEARARKAADPFEQLRVRVGELDLPGRCQRVVDALAERHHELGAALRGKPVMIGYGGRTAVERPRQEDARLPALAETARLHRRTVQRAIADLVGAGLLHRRYGGPEDADEPRQVVHVPCQRQKYLKGEGKVGYRPVGERRAHTIGRGGCDRGGVGWANQYWPDGIAGPEPPPLPAPLAEPEPPPRPQGGRRPLRELVDLRDPRKPRGP